MLYEVITDGTILSYQKEDVIRIQKTSSEKQSDGLPGKDPEIPIKPPAKQAEPAPKIKQPAPSDRKALPPKDSKIVLAKPDSSETKGLEFYNPRRPQKYWTSA